MLQILRIILTRSSQTLTLAITQYVFESKRKTFQMNLRKICLSYVFKLHALDIQQTLRMRYFMLKQYCLFTDSMKFVDLFKLIEQLEITLFVAYVIFSHMDQETRFPVK
ncbi:Hypothetical_protein [Hexamita inflata]|uniref:Hypothetical_protein n=1 Tax=Hexamita inflata TaxID=28002 RepID=A0AA86TJT2_9EUKA|nr:Hypothetical protein HINF_LOCUS7021 [Hexamita inflata]